MRIEYPGAVYHITSRGNDRCDIFLDDGDRREFLELLGEVVRRFEWIVTAYTTEMGSELRTSINPQFPFPALPLG